METESLSQIRDRICKGCSSAINDNEGCTVCVEPTNDNEGYTVCVEPTNDRGETCPCSNCLIKMICVESCLEFRDYCRH